MERFGPAWIDRLPDEMSGQRQILRRLLSACEADPDIQWLVVAASVGRGAGDRLSDLDLGVGVADERFGTALVRVRDLTGALGDLVDSYQHQIPGLCHPHERIFAQYADRCQVDLVVFPASQQVGGVKDAVVLYDPGRRVTGRFEDRAVTPGQVREWAFRGWCALADIGKYLRRGSPWEALGRLGEAREALWRLWAVASGVPNPQLGVTSVLDFAPEAMPEWMADTVADLDPGRLLAAARQLAARLAGIGEHLTDDHRAALPAAMARFVVADLSDLAEGPGGSAAAGR